MCLGREEIRTVAYTAVGSRGVRIVPGATRTQGEDAAMEIELRAAFRATLSSAFTCCQLAFLERFGAVGFVETPLTPLSLSLSLARKSAGTDKANGG